MPFNPAPVKAGDPIRAADVNAQNEEIARLGRESTGPGLASRSNAGGRQITRVDPEKIWIKLTSTASSGAYAWKEVWHTRPNTWIDGVRTGTTTVDPAYPASGDTSLTVDGKVWEAKRGATSGGWIFN